MTQFNTTANAIQPLLRLDAEMEGIRTRRLHRKVNAVRNGVRIPVNINRDRSQHGYYGSATFNGKAFSSWGKLPSTAFLKITSQIDWAIQEYAVKSNYAADAVALLASTRTCSTCPDTVVTGTQCRACKTVFSPFGTRRARCS